jgi:hypothetical protein
VTYHTRGLITCGLSDKQGWSMEAGKFICRGLSPYKTNNMPESLRVLWKVTNSFKPCHHLVHNTEESKSLTKVGTLNCSLLSFGNFHNFLTLTGVTWVISKVTLPVDLGSQDSPLFLLSHLKRGFNESMWRFCVKLFICVLWASLWST